MYKLFLQSLYPDVLWLSIRYMASDPHYPYRLRVWNAKNCPNRHNRDPSEPTPLQANRVHTRRDCLDCHSGLYFGVAFTAHSPRTCHVRKWGSHGHRKTTTTTDRLGIKHSSHSRFSDTVCNPFAYIWPIAVPAMLLSSSDIRPRPYLIFANDYN